MNILRNLARNLWNAIEIKGATAPEAGAKTLHAVRQQRVPGVLGLGRFRDGFDQLPQGPAAKLRTAERAFRPTFSPAQLQRDGFDVGRRAPLNLSGAVKSSAQQKPEAKATLQNFGATLTDLAALVAA